MAVPQPHLADAGDGVRRQRVAEGDLARRFLAAHSSEIHGEQTPPQCNQRPVHVARLLSTLARELSTGGPLVKDFFISVDQSRQATAIHCRRHASTSSSLES